MGLADTCIPEDKLPQCWSDDVRMNALFAPFRLKSANPESWDMKMKFWGEMLRLWCRCKEDPIVSAADAKVAFQRKGRTPACLEIVVEETYRNGDLSPISKYQQILHSGREGWLGWGARLAFKPAEIAVTAVGYLLPKRQLVDNDGLPKASIDSTQRFVLEIAVKEQAMHLIQNYPAHEPRVGTIEDIMLYCNKLPSQRETFEILLGYLVSQGMAVKKGDVVKLADSSTTVTPITQTDEALVKLTSAERKLTRDAARLIADAATAAVDAKAAKQCGNIVAAKNHLRRKIKLLDRAGKCESALENVRSMLQGMREMEINLAVVDTYRTSTQAMKQGMEEGGLDQEKVHDTMDDLKEVLDNYSEVERALSGTTEDIDAEELEAELADLMKGGSGGGGGEKIGEGSLNLPSPPKARLNSEQEFVFDGEARMLAELGELGLDDTPRGKGKERRVREKVAVADDGWGKATPSTPSESRAWYPQDKKITNLDKSLDELCNQFEEVKTDDRLHPGQKLDVDFTKPPQLYKNDFQIADHNKEDGVWLFSPNDEKKANKEFTAGTDYTSLESPGKFASSFQMAPGGERKTKDGTEDLQARLDRLRKLN